MILHTIISGKYREPSPSTRARLLVDATIENERSEFPFVYDPDDNEGLSPDVNAWFFANPDFEIEPYVEPEPEPAPVFTRLYKSSLIRRMSTSEAETFESVLLAETAYVRMLYNSVEWFDMSDALVSYMHLVFVGIVGEERADELLAPEI